MKLSIQEKSGEKKLRIGILSLGCPRNLVDSENILGRLRNKGFPLVDIEQADVAIINTCSFIKDAKVESIDAILEAIDLKKQGKIKKIIVYGCLVQRYEDELARNLPEVDAFIGRVSLNHAKDICRITPLHYAYLKICEGCVNNCSFCIIPKIKGRFSSLEERTILEKVEFFNKERISELNIIGQDISGYGLDLYRKRSLPVLLKKIVSQADNIGWIRLLYLYPHPIVYKVVDFMRSEPKICRYIDLPLQHINTRVLKLMQRRGSKGEILRLIEGIRKNIPNAAIRTTFIVGFPSETDKEFKELLDFVSQVRFERLGVFIYSPEEGTRACHFKKQIPQRIKVERFNAIMSLQQKISSEYNQKFLGRDIKVLIDEALPDYYLGRTEHDAPEVDGSVHVRSKKRLKPGDFVQVKIDGALEYDLTGEVN